MLMQSVRMAWKAFVSNKMRSFLTMLGIIIGVFTLDVLVSLVNGATDSVTDSISSLGRNLLSVSIADDKGNPLKLEELEAFAENEEIDKIAPLAQSSMTVTGLNREETAMVYGTTESYFDIQGLEETAGRTLKSVDVENHVNAAVISYDTAIDVLGRADVVGETIKLDGMQYEIIGVLEEEDSNSLTSMLSGSYQIYIPFTSIVRMQTGLSDSITSFYVSAANENTMDDAEQAVETLLLQRFGQDEEAFGITNQSSIMEVMDSVTGTLSLLLGGIAGISLLVGGIGIMNIMLVSVTERTREIGIRKAIGASRQTIMLQFLIEAFVVSLMGCAIGIGLSWIGMKIVNRIGNVDFGLSPGVVAVSVIFSLIVGLAFGLYPANKAAKKKPIDALRYAG